MLMSICGSFAHCPGYIFQTCICLVNNSLFLMRSFLWLYMFTVKEINRLKILQDVIDRNLHPGQAAEMLCITPRHCSRLLKRYRQSGPPGMNNQSRGHIANHLLPASLTELALNIIRERYSDFGPTMRFDTLAKVCQALECQPGDILAWEAD